MRHSGHASPVVFLLATTLVIVYFAYRRGWRPNLRERLRDARRGQRAGTPARFRPLALVPTIVLAIVVLVLALTH